MQNHGSNACSICKKWDSVSTCLKQNMMQTTTEHTCTRVCEKKACTVCEKFLKHKVNNPTEKPWLSTQLSHSSSPGNFRDAHGMDSTWHKANNVAEGCQFYYRSRMTASLSPEWCPLMQQQRSCVGWAAWSSYCSPKLWQRSQWTWGKNRTSFR